MDELIQALIMFDKEHYCEQEKIEVEGANFLKNFGMITRMVSDIVDMLITKSYVSKEEADFIIDCQMRCIGELGEIEDKINE